MNDTFIFNIKKEARNEIIKMLKRKEKYERDKTIKSTLRDIRWEIDSMNKK